MISKYNLDDFHTAQEFLSQLAVKMGFLRKGAIADVKKAAQKVLIDWNNGRLTYFTEPPERSNDIVSTELVQQFRDAFDIDGLLDDDDDVDDDDDEDQTV